MEETININYIDDFEEFRKNNIFIINNILFIQYLNVLYPNLVLRENDLSDIIEQHNNKADILSYNNALNNKSLLEKYISNNTFNQYMGIQDLISERIFKYIDKSKKGKITKNDFCNGMYQIFFGNISELSKFTFFICDFNEDGKIYKFDMKLILSYIPMPTNNNYSNQQEYIKEINHIIDDFFKEIKEENAQSEEIDYNLYLTKVTESINDNVINGAFFLFINLLKYIFINKPFNKEVIYFVNFIKNKHLLKVTLPKGSAIKSMNIFQKKSVAKSEVFDGNINNNFNINNDNNIFNFTRKKEKKYTDYKNHELNNNFLGKIQQKDLFSVKKSSSTVNIDKKEQKKYETLKHDFIIAKKKEKENKQNEVINKIVNGLNIKNITTNRNSSLGKLNNAQKIPNNIKTIHINNKINKILLQNFQKTSIKNFGNNTNYNGFENQNKKTILPSISTNSPLKNMIQNNVKKKNPNLKIAPIKLKNKTSSQDTVLLKENKTSNFSEEICGKESGVYLYKFSEEDYHIVFKKYYAVINKKEILFFSSNLKNELCTIWNFNNTVISIQKKASINKYVYYPIKIIYRNKGTSILFFEERETQIEFGKQLKINIDNNNFEDKYETKDKIGEGNFAVVKKCVEKNSGKEYAVKIITKQKLAKTDLELIIHEKNYMKLIKHPNIVSLIGDFEDEKYIYLVMEYYKGGDLFTYISEYRRNQKYINERSIAKIIKVVAQSIQYLNYFGIVHRDLKPENIVFGTKDDISSLTIIDLGVAITLSYGQMNDEPLGTLEYISPEIFTHQPYNHKVDIWSLGIILYILVTVGKIYPFDSNSKDKKEKDKIIGKKIVFLQQEYPEEFFGNKSKYLINLIDKSLEKSPDKRISIDDFLNNYWLINNSK